MKSSVCLVEPLLIGSSDIRDIIIAKDHIVTGLDRRNNASENKKENCAITRLLNSRLCGNDMVKAVSTDADGK